VELIIPVKLKPFREWPCQREGFVNFSARENMEKIGGLEIEINTRPLCSDPWRKGYAWHVTHESIQRMYAVGAIGPYGIMSMRYASRMLICEHVIQSPSVGGIALRTDLARLGLRRSCPKRNNGFEDWRIGKFFLRDWSKTWTAVWMGTVVRCIGDRGWPLYLVRLFPGCESIWGDEDEQHYFVSVAEMSYWHFYDSEKDMMNAYADFRRHAEYQSRLQE